MDSKPLLRLLLSIPLLGIGLSLLGTPARAQTRRPGTVDLTAGPATSRGGNRRYDLRNTPSLTFDWVPEHRGPGIWDLSLGLRPQLGDVSGLVCRVNPDGSGACLPAFPWLAPFGVLAGVEGVGPASDYRLTIGPMLYLGGISAWGGRAQLVLAAGSSKLKLVAAVRADLLRHSAETVQLGSLEAGVRIF